TTFLSVMLGRSLIAIAISHPLSSLMFCLVEGFTDEFGRRREWMRPVFEMPVQIFINHSDRQILQPVNDPPPHPFRQTRHGNQSDDNPSHDPTPSVIRMISCIPLLPPFHRASPSRGADISYSTI